MAIQIYDIPANFQVRSNSTFRMIDVTPAIYTPTAIVGSSTPEYRAIALDGDGSKINAHSKVAPHVHIAPTDRTRWETLLADADELRIPRDKLFIDRPYRIAVERVENRIFRESSRYGVPVFHVLRAVEILGDFTKSRVIDDTRAILKQWFD